MCSAYIAHAEAVTAKMEHATVPIAALIAHSEDATAHIAAVATITVAVTAHVYPFESVHQVQKNGAAVFEQLQ